MLTTKEGIYENGQITLKEQPAIQKPVKVFVTFIEEKVENKILPEIKPSQRLRGAWKNLSQQDQEEIKSYFDHIRKELVLGQY